MVNTPQSQYQLTKLQVGVHSATGIFQQEMNTQMKDIPFCKVGVDYILISGPDDDNQLMS